MFFPHGELMFYAIGIDLIEIDRIQRSLEQFGDNFLKRLSSETEMGYLKSLKLALPVAVARQFAAKEAVMKALGAFFDRGVRLKDIEICEHQLSQPKVRLPERLGAELKGKDILVSISYDEHLAIATAAITDEA